ncbi:MAG TPA: glycosyltransferase family A protein [Candidatus Andersenbacteria bacterium]|nr:glycosyltransferase family A protein [Candidatus Andersenbacteria bacterium]
MSAKITVVMSTRNDGQYLETALKSLLSQTFKDWELLIINDASTDNTEEIIHRLFGQDSRLFYVKNFKNLGVTINIKRLIRKANTEFIARLDGDDYWIDRRKLSQQYKIITQDETIGMIGTWAKVVDLHGKELYKVRYSLTDKSIRKRMLYENPFITSSTLFRKPKNSEVAQIKPLNKYADDYNLVLQVGITKKLMNIPIYATAYRINPAGVSQTKAHQQIQDTMRIIEQYKPYYPGYRVASLLWKLRINYPIWMKGKMPMEVKNTLKYYS